MQAALPLMVAGSLVQGVAGYQSNKYNQRAAEANATNAERDGTAQVAQVRDNARLAMGRQIGAQAESGFTVGTGSALDSLRESAINAELDVLNVRRKAASAAAAARSQAAVYGSSANMSLLGGFVGAAGAVANYKANYANASSAAGYGRSG